MKITDKRVAYSPLIEGGDFILLPDGRMFVVIIPVNVSADSDSIALIDLETGKFYLDNDSHAWFNHPQHMRNHLKKHYAAYHHIKNKQMEVIIHEQTYSGF